MMIEKANFSEIRDPCKYLLLYRKLFCLKKGEACVQGSLASISHQTYILSSQGCGKVSMTHLPQSCPVSSSLR